MPHIIKLDKKTAELIAAGEVVERPSSVVKELLENAIDAKSESVTVEIQNGGISYIRVSDTGCGINKDEVPLAFLKNATSKIKTKDDLDSIGTLGFRGEALSSICAMAKVEMITRVQEEIEGSYYLIEGGEAKKHEAVGCPVGTTIVVRDLFYNIPARMKFLKKNTAESAAVGSVVEKIALSHPEVSIRFIRDGKEIINTPGDAKLKSVIHCIFGKQLTQNMLELNYELNGIKVTGFISKPSETKATRSMQNFFINGRFVKSGTASAAVLQGYKSLIMTGKFPICVINIQMNLTLVDVNVHPAKIEVRFFNEAPVFDAVYGAVVSTLERDTNEIKKAIEPLKTLTNSELLQKATPQTVQMQFNYNDKPISQVKDEPINHFNKTEAKEEMPSQVFSFSEFAPYTVEKPKTVFEPVNFNKNDYTLNSTPTTQIKKEEAIEQSVVIEQKNKVEFKIKGEIFNTYIILETNQDKVLLIDKHAAHERLIYNKLKETNLQKESQKLLTPIDVKLSSSEYIAIIENLELLNQSGFEIDDYGMNCVIVRSCPLYLENRLIADEVTEIASYLSQNIKDLSTNYKEWLYSTIACKSAIKGGDYNNQLELIELVKTLYNNPNVKSCPHGRPIYTVLTKYEIERKFGRS